MFSLCCLIVALGLGLGSGLDLVSGWLVVMRTYLYYYRLSLSHCVLGKAQSISSRAQFTYLHTE